MDLTTIDNLGLARVLQRGTGEIIAEQENALLLKDIVSGAYLFACDDAAAGLPILDQHIGPDCDLLMVSDYALGMAAFERYGFADKLECYQVAYYGEKPTVSVALSVRTAEEHDLPLLTRHYQLLSADELGEIIRRKNLLLGYCHDQLVGFIGEHLEGSMGILYVLPEYRHKGRGAALQTHLIAKTMEEGYIPFGQVVKDNAASLALQKKLGMTRSDNMIVWMWK